MKLTFVATLALCFIVVQVSAAPAGINGAYVQHYPGAYTLSSETSSDGDESGS